jgi:hypothetical protein
MSVNDAFLLTNEILLEAPGCVKMEATVLVCSCASKRPGKSVLHAFCTNYYVSGFDGEIYALRNDSEICGDHVTLAIDERLVGRLPGDESFSSSRQRLRGISRVFESEWRRLNEDRRRSDSVGDDSVAEKARSILQLGDLRIIRPYNIGIDGNYEDYDSWAEDDADDGGEDDDDDLTSQFLREVLLKFGGDDSSDDEDDDDVDDFGIDMYVL